MNVTKAPTAILREQTKIDEIIVAKVVVVGSNESMQPKEETSHGSIHFQQVSSWWLCLLMILGISLFAWTW
jgi:hypothetical protein